MSAKIVKSSIELGNKIRLRRNELGFTIEEAASKAGIGTKTWSRYEAGESIRRDKVTHVCKALNWHTLPDLKEPELPEPDLNTFQRSGIWSKTLADSFGDAAAISFVIGSDILLDNIEQDLKALSHKPKGTHIGELDCSWLKDSLPPQFLTQYDYDFLYFFKTTLLGYRNQAASNRSFIAHTVMEELALYLIMEESEFSMESILPYLQSEDDNDCDWDSWVFDLFGDMDIVTLLYSDYYLDKDNSYHFDHWREQQFYTAS